MECNFNLWGEPLGIVEGELSDKYSNKVDTPIYEPKNRCPHILELVNVEKTKRLIREIEASSITDEEKTFLIEAAHRHSIFDYACIADYYAHATKEMQNLMEKSALVIIDFEKAIENGFVELNEKMKALYERELQES